MITNSKDDICALFYFSCVGGGCTQSWEELGFYARTEMSSLLNLLIATSYT
jgi:hypothetical protein